MMRWITYLIRSFESSNYNIAYSKNNSLCQSSVSWNVTRKIDYVSNAIIARF